MRFKKIGRSILIVEDMAEYIMPIFRAYAMLVSSWGFNTPTAIANCLRFKVSSLRTLLRWNTTKVQTFSI